MRSIAIVAVVLALLALSVLWVRPRTQTRAYDDEVELDDPPASAENEPTRPPVEVPPWASVAPEQIAAASECGLPVAFENELGMRFLLVPAGTYLMGSPAIEEGRDEDESQHRATIATPFYVQIKEVTNATYRAFDATHSSAGPKSRRHFALDADDRPVLVNQLCARHFAIWLSTRDGARTYRLPTEVEWEYVCRAGTQSAYWWGNERESSWRYENLSPFGAHGDDGHERSAPGAQYPPNPWGLYDMLGNVSELCATRYMAYPGAPLAVKRRIHAVQRHRPCEIVVRGGSYLDPDDYARCAYRDTAHPEASPRESRKVPAIGFRLVSPIARRSR